MTVGTMTTTRPPAGAQRFPCDPAQVHNAREYVRDRAGRHPRSADAELLTSEATTNAITHAGSDLWLRVFTEDRAIRVEVWDTGASDVEPTLHVPDDDEIGGRGLLMIDAIATEWGHRKVGDFTVVWFILAAPIAR